MITISVSLHNYLSKCLMLFNYRYNFPIKYYYIKLLFQIHLSHSAVNIYYSKILFITKYFSNIRVYSQSNYIQALAI